MGRTTKKANVAKSAGRENAPKLEPRAGRAAKRRGRHQSDVFEHTEISGRVLRFVYSLGRVIAWALTRHPPVPNIDLPAPGRWRTLVAKMTAQDREARHDSLAAVSELQQSGSSLGQLIAFGPDVITERELIEIAGQSWSIEVDRFIVGDEHDLLRQTDGFEQLLPHERHVTIELHGEGRLLTAPPRFTRKGTSWSVQVTVASRFERTHVDEIGEDISIEDEDFGCTLRGRERLPQIFLIALSTERDALLGDPHWGSLVRRRFTELGDTPLFERAVALEDAACGGPLR